MCKQCSHVPSQSSRDIVSYTLIYSIDDGGWYYDIVDELTGVRMPGEVYTRKIDALEAAMRQLERTYSGRRWLRLNDL